MSKDGEYRMPRDGERQRRSCIQNRLTGEEFAELLESPYVTDLIREKIDQEAVRAAYTTKVRTVADLLVVKRLVDRALTDLGYTAKEDCDG